MHACIHLLESVFRQCLSDGTWFSCPGLNTSQGLGWTNYSLCWTASTQKIMADLNQTPNCPSAASDEDNSAEVRVFSKGISVHFCNMSTSSRGIHIEILCDFCRCSRYKLLSSRCTLFYGQKVLNCTVKKMRLF